MTTECVGKTWTERLHWKLKLEQCTGNAWTWDALRGGEGQACLVQPSSSCTACPCSWLFDAYHCGLVLCVL
eukprot:710478-Pelagomonas_calceolata.AAC.6